MTPEVISVKSTDTLATARVQLRDHRIHHLLVIDDEAVVGVISYRDLIGKNDTDRVAQVMSNDLATCEPWETVRNAATRMIGRTHGCLPVMEAGKLAGIITTTDLLRAVSHTPRA
jgi:acetoin utilization protein AcuB